MLFPWSQPLPLAPSIFPVFFQIEPWSLKEMVWCWGPTEGCSIVEWIFCNSTLKKLPVTWTGRYFLVEYIIGLSQKATWAHPEMWKCLLFLPGYSPTPPLEWLNGPWKCPPCLSLITTPTVSPPLLFLQWPFQCDPFSPWCPKWAALKIQVKIEPSTRNPSNLELRAELNKLLCLKPTPICLCVCVS